MAKKQIQTKKQAKKIDLFDNEGTSQSSSKDNISLRDDMENYGNDFAIGELTISSKRVVTAFNNALKKRSDTDEAPRVGDANYMSLTVDDILRDDPHVSSRRVEGEFTRTLQNNVSRKRRALRKKPKL